MVETSTVAGSKETEEGARDRLRLEVSELPERGSEGKTLRPDALLSKTTPEAWEQERFKTQGKINVDTGLE